MRTRLPYLILAGVCVVLVVLIEPAAGPAPRDGDAPSHTGSTVGPMPHDLAQVVDVSSGLDSAPGAPEPPIRSSAPDAARLFLAGLVLVSLAAAAKRA